VAQSPTGGDFEFCGPPPLSSFWRMKPMTKHRSYSAALERHVAKEFIAGKTRHARFKRRDIPRPADLDLVGRFESGAPGDNELGDNELGCFGA